jgi:hypothetical protein
MNRLIKTWYGSPFLSGGHDMSTAYPGSGHGSLFQDHESFTRQAAAFLGSDPPFAPY